MNPVEQIAIDQMNECVEEINGKPIDARRNGLQLLELGPFLIEGHRNVEQDVEENGCGKYEETFNESH